MQNAIYERLKQIGKGLSLLIVDDDFISLDVYEKALTEFFPQMDMSVDGKEAYEKWSKKAPDFKYDVIVTDILMPTMNGFELIKKIREESREQKFIVLTSMDNLNEMKEVINLGIEGVLQKPFVRDKFLEVIGRVAANVHAEKILKTTLVQLKMSATHNVELKTACEKEVRPKQREPQIKKDSIAQYGALTGRYTIRATLAGESSKNFLMEASYLDIDKMDAFQDKMILCEVELCKGSNFLDDATSKQTLKKVIDELNEFADALNIFGKFPVASNAATKLANYLSSLDKERLQDIKRRELMIDAILCLLQDINDWIIAVFINKTAININYFDASFANSCMEIELIFASQETRDGDDDYLEFF